MRLIKSNDEINGIITNYRKSFEEKFGQYPLDSDLKAAFDMLINEKQEADFRSRFETLSTEHLVICRDFVSKQQVTISEPIKSDFQKEYDEFKQTIDNDAASLEIGQKGQKSSTKRQKKSKE